MAREACRGGVPGGRARRSKEALTLMARGVVAAAACQGRAATTRIARCRELPRADERWMLHKAKRVRFDARARFHWSP